VLINITRLAATLPHNNYQVNKITPLHPLTVRLFRYRCHAFVFYHCILPRRADALVYSCGFWCLICPVGRSAIAVPGWGKDPRHECSEEWPDCRQARSQNTSGELQEGPRGSSHVVPVWIQRPGYVMQGAYSDDRYDTSAVTTRLVLYLGKIVPPEPGWRRMFTKSLARIQ